jgi:hypothetical protein
MDTTEPQTPGIAARAEAALFKVSDVPKFEKRSDYTSYRVALQLFFDGTVAPPADLFGTALNRIMASWTDPTVRQAAVGWKNAPLLINANGSLRPWGEVTKAFLLACDKKFLSSVAYENATRAWYAVRARENMDPLDFFLDFEAAANTLNEMSEIFGLPKLSDHEINSQLLRVIPAFVRDSLRHSLKMMFPPRRPETLDFNNLRERIIDTWSYAPKPSAAAPRARTNRAGTPPGQTSGSSSALVVSGQNAPRNEARMRQCGLVVSYDTAPAVPSRLRGPIYDNGTPNPEISARREACVQAGVCEYCRRPRSEHHAVSANYKEIPRANRGSAENRRGGNTQNPPRARIADISGPRVEDVTDAASALSVD